MVLVTLVRSIDMGLPRAVEQVWAYISNVRIKKMILNSSGMTTIDGWTFIRVVDLARTGKVLLTKIDSND